jgi:hypothetical protein
LGDARPIPSFEGSPARALEIVAVAHRGLHLGPLPNRTTSAFNFRRRQTLIAYRRPDEPRRKGVISRSSVNLFMCTGGAYRPLHGSADPCHATVGAHQRDAGVRPKTVISASSRIHGPKVLC